MIERAVAVLSMGIVVAGSAACRSRREAQQSGPGDGRPVATLAQDAATGPREPRLAISDLRLTLTPMGVVSGDWADPPVSARSNFLDTKLTVAASAAFDEGSHLQVKASCQTADERLIDVGSPFDLDDLSQLTPGEASPQVLRLFGEHGLVGTPGRCELAFHIATGEGANSDPLGSWCWSGGQVSAGPCAPGAPTSLDGTADALTHLDARPSRNIDGSRYVFVDATLRFGTSPAYGEVPKLRAVCRAGDDDLWSDLPAQLLYPHVKPGDSIRTTVGLFANGLPFVPEHCEITAVIEQVPSGSTRMLATFCLRGEVLAPGSC